MNTQTAVATDRIARTEDVPESSNDHLTRAINFGFSRDSWLHASLSRKLCEAGCFDRSVLTDAVNIGFVLSCFALSYTTLLMSTSWLGRAAALLLGAFATVQAGFIGHEVSHLVIFRRRRLAEVWGQILMTLSTGLSYGYFCFFHAPHHVDPVGTTWNDLQNGAPDATVNTKGRGKRVAVGWMLASLRGFFMKLESLRHLWAHPATTRVDQWVMGLHLLVWLVIPAAVIGITDAAVNYALITLLAGPYASVVFLSNHHVEGLDRPATEIPYLQRQLMTTRNLGSSWWENFLFGGVNHHVEHHLFAAIPRAQLSRAREITENFCREHGLPYQAAGLRQAIAGISRRFADGQSNGLPKGSPDQRGGV